MNIEKIKTEAKTLWGFFVEEIREHPQDAAIIIVVSTLAANILWTIDVFAWFW